MHAEPRQPTLSAPPESLPPDDAATARVRAVWDRFNILDNTHEILQAVGRGDSRLEELGTFLAPMRAVVAGLYERAMQGADVEAILHDTEREVTRIERTLVTVERSLPKRVFRRRFHPREHSWSALTRYAEFIARHHTSDHHGRERIEVVVTRLLQAGDAEDPNALIDREEAQPVLELIADGVEVSSELRCSAIEFFAGAEAKLAGLADLDEVFDGGFYVDLCGYKITLEEAVLDPDILYAATQLNLTVAAKLEALGAGQLPEAIDDRIAIAEARARKIFADIVEPTVPDPNPPGRRSTPPEAKDDEKKKKKKKKKKKDKWKQYRVKTKKNRDGKIIKVVTPPASSRAKVTVAVVALALSFVLQAGLNALLAENRLVPIELETLHEMSAVLASGSFSEGDSATVMLAHVNPHDWSSLDSGERQAAADAVRDALLERGVRSALILKSQGIAFRIERGHVRFVQ